MDEQNNSHTQNENTHEVTKSPPIKPIKKLSRNTSLRIPQDTQKKITLLLNKVNKKDFGRKLKSYELIDVALDLLNDHHLKNLQQKSLSNSDVLEMRFKEYIKKNGKISKDKFLGILLEKGLE